MPELMIDLPRELFGDLTDDQRRAATSVSCNVLVTAGAGTGKTKALVARYVALLAQGCQPPEILAVTFTEKAALEMRGRVRTAVSGLVAAHDGPKQALWLQAESQLDAARIGTIHSFCAELLRSHPAEAGVDPRFVVAEEGLSAALKAEAVEAALEQATDDLETAPLFDVSRGDALYNLMATLMRRRPDAAEAFRHQGDAAAWSAFVERQLLDFAAQAEVREAIAELEALQAVEGPDSRRRQAVAALLAGWRDFVAWLEVHESARAAVALFNFRRQHLVLSKADAALKPPLGRLRQAYSQTVAPWVKGDKSYDAPPDLEIEARFPGDMARLARLFGIAEGVYRDALAKRQALDYDDLELGALRLLANATVRQRWQEKLKAILIDEYQDTNARQAAIIEALCGDHADRLFVVGDARQSIYRFRGADVTVFREIEERFRNQDWPVVHLSESFRTHVALLEALDRMLEPVMRVSPDSPPYEIGYGVLAANRLSAPPSMPPPYVEFCLGTGSNASSARPVAARLLAHRLSQLRLAGQIDEWSDVAVLFRSSRSYRYYEEAFEAAGVPFVTVAGIGFYDRQEVRDLLNMLLAIAEPWNDLAMAGLLRSPAFGVTDSGLYRLLMTGEQRSSLRRAMAGDLAAMEATDAERVRRAARILDELEPLADRLTVAELLTELLDRTDYRAVLASAGVSRLWRNVDKLVDDARASGLVRVRQFLEYLRTLRDVEVREGEAAVEAAGAVRLMTIHRAKGLEFPVVVLGDASHAGGARQQPAYFVKHLGVAAVPSGRAGAAKPLPVRLAAFKDARESLAEERRLLYVAATRARDKLIISGTVTGAEKSLKAAGWLERLLEALQVDLAGLVERADDGWQEHRVGETPYGFCVVRGDESAVEGSLAEPVADAVVEDALPASCRQCLPDQQARQALTAPTPGPAGAPGWLSNGPTAAGPPSSSEASGITAASTGTPAGPSAPAPDSSDEAPQSPGEASADAASKPGPAAAQSQPLYEPLAVIPPRRRHWERPAEPTYPWRASGEESVPATALGNLVHRALEHWLFPDDLRLDALLEAAALEERLVTDDLRRQAVAQAKELLARFRAHELWSVIDGVGPANRSHELPYVAPADWPGGPMRTGHVDLVYGDACGWHVLDFKTDHLAGVAQVAAIVRARGYDQQLRTYVADLGHLLSVSIDARLVFLDVGGAVHAEPVPVGPATTSEP